MQPFWKVEQLGDGWAWTARTAEPGFACRVIVARSREGHWYSSALCIQNQRSAGRGQFHSELASPLGLERCLAWAYRFVCQYPGLYFDVDKARNIVLHGKRLRQ